MSVKKLFIAFVLIIGIFSFNSTVKANEIYSIDTEVEILEDGSGNITQTWNTFVDEGTEFFIPIQYLNHMNLKNVSVSMDGREFEFVDDWDIDKSFEEKAYKYGILETDEGYEISFGMSEREVRTYDIKFTYENMVQSFTDKDGFNVRFVNNDMDPAPRRVSLSMHSPVIDFSEDNTKIWAFGYNGNINFDNGNIVARSTSEFDSSNHLTTLVEIEKGHFSPTYISNYSFEDLKVEAFEGSSYSQGDTEFENSNFNSMEEEFDMRILLIIPASLLVVFGAIVGASNKMKTKFNNKNIPINNSMSQEIPLDGNINANYYFLRNTYKNDQDSVELNFNLLTAYFAKWAEEGILSNEFKILKSPSFNEESFEKKLWDFIIKGGVFQNKIDSEQLENYTEENYYEFMNLFTLANREGFDFSLKNDFIRKDKKFLVVTEYNLTDKGKNELNKVYGFKNYINDNSFYEEFNKENSKKLKEIFIYSNLYSDNEKLVKYLDDKVDKNQNFGYFPYYLFYINSNQHRASVSKGYETGINNASSGSGGGASFGGGGGFSGGGSGGGAR